jgi:hypothetical protein
MQGRLNACFRRKNRTNPKVDEPPAKLMGDNWLPNPGPFPSWNFGAWNHQVLHFIPKMASK